MTDESMKWPVVPLSQGQMMDVREEDVLNNGLYRKCSTYRGGGGYDQFPYICERRFGQKMSNQFIVQLQKCVLDCHYCYVTRAGVWGPPEDKSTDDLVNDFLLSGQEVFHLMGGAPAIYLDRWPALIDAVMEAKPDAIFHSDLMLIEGSYKPETLKALCRDRCLFAVNIKGLDDEDWYKNTRIPPKWDLFWGNWRLLQWLGLPYYTTFTGVPHDKVDDFWIEASKHGIEKDSDSYIIDLIEYEATSHVDDVKWGVSNNG